MNKRTHTSGSSIILGVAFVWFTTHFGGGFASGAQIYSYFLRYGIWSLIMPLIAMAYNGVFFAYSLRFARRHGVYDYRSYNNAFYGRYAWIFSNLFEVLYICVMCVAPAVAFATGGATLRTLTGLPYLLCTLIIGVFIFVVAIFGTDLVRKVSTVLSICIIAGLLVVYIPNILAGAGNIASAAAAMRAQELPLGDALYSAFIYGSFQLSNIAVFVQHARPFDRPNDAIRSMAIGSVINALMMTMVVLGLMTVYTNPDLVNQSIPTLFMVQNGVGTAFLTPMISILIILGAVSTAVNMVAAMVKRVDDGLERLPQVRQNRAAGASTPSSEDCAAGASVPASEDRAAGVPIHSDEAVIAAGYNADGHADIAATSDATGTAGMAHITGRQIVIALLCCLVDYGIAQFGLLTLVQRAYGSLAYLAIPVILIPYIVHMVVTRWDTK